MTSHSTDLFRLVYYSRNRIGSDTTDAQAAIEGILAASRRNNTASGVSGALLFNAGCFGQVLEGNRQAVENTFERIQRDPRHGDVSLLDFSPLDTRGFDRWSMAFIGEDPSGNDLYGHLARDSGFDPSRMSGDHLYEALKRLAHEEECSHP